MSDLTAIDILVNPDEATIQHAHRWNARMRESVPDGFALDDTHQPHITTLQRYVRTADLDDVYDAVEQTLAATDIARSRYQAVAIRHADWGVPGQGLAVIVVAAQRAGARLPGRATRRGHAVHRVRRHRRSLRSRSRRGDQPEHHRLGRRIRPRPNRAGKYIAHITVGFATLDDLERIEAEPFDAFTVQPASLAVYHLGNSGAARTQLKAWPLTT